MTNMVSNKPLEVKWFTNKWLVLVVALVVWAAFFHTIDWALMEAQGLPVKMSLMPR